MLQKSHKMFNFANVSQSLYELYVNHLSKNASSQVKADLHRMGHRQDGGLASVNNSSVDPEVAKRMMLIKSSKSTLIVPLLVPFR